MDFWIAPGRAKSDPNPQISARPGSTGKGREGVNPSPGTEGLGIEAFRTEGQRRFRDCGQRVSLNHCRPEGWWDSAGQPLARILP